jgi:hypothetical protein
LSPPKWIASKRSAVKELHIILKAIKSAIFEDGLSPLPSTLPKQKIAVIAPLMVFL